MEIREARGNDLVELLGLYAQLHKNALDHTVAAGAIWRKIMADQNHHVLVAAVDGTIVSSCVLLVVPNLTHGGRPLSLLKTSSQTRTAETEDTPQPF